MKKYIFIITLLLFFILPSGKSQGATLYLSPASGQHSISSSFSVSVNVNSSETFINAVDAIINYPEDMLSVKSVSKNSSILKLWPKEPTFSNGIISFSGGIPAPGFTGTGNGLVINFVGKKEGIANISFSSGMVLAADGRGTNILSSKSGATFVITPKSETPTTPQKTTETKKESSLIDINSSTHPNQDQWYNNSNPSLLWKIPPDIEAESIEFDENPSTNPDLISNGIFDSIKYENTADGIWYFHLRVKNKNGWGKTSHFKVQIDTTLPKDLEIKIDNKEDPTNPQPNLYINAIDNLSGINHYDIVIDSKSFSSITPSETNPFIMPIQLPGSHNITVIAVDKAGNRTEKKIKIEIESIKIPEITVYPSLYKAGDEMIYIEGRSLPNATIIINLTKNENNIKSWETTSDDNGNWSYSTEELFKKGTYHITAQAKDERGAISYPSEKKEIKILLSGIALGSFLINYWQLTLILIFIIILIIALIIIIIYKSKKEKESIKKEVLEAEKSLKDTFIILKNKIEKRVEDFDHKPGLSIQEKKIRDDIFKILESSKKIVGKEIKDIEDKLD